MRPPKRTIHVMSSWVRWQPPKVKAFLAVVSGMLALVLLRVIVHDHDNLFVDAEAVHSIGTSVLIYKLMKEKTCADEEKLFADSAQNVYNQFRDKAASSRSMSVDKMEEIAQGRVWTGNDAASRGLVNAIGGFSRAVAISKQKANIPHDQKVTLVEMTIQKDRSLIKLLFQKNSAIGIDMTLKQLQDGLTSSDGVQARMDQTILQGLDGSSVANDGLRSTYHCWMPHSPFPIALAYWVVGLVLQRILLVCKMIKCFILIPMKFNK